MIRRMVEADIALIAACARQADIDEMQACAGATIEQALELGLAKSLRAFVIEADGKPLAAVGDTLHAIGVGVPWMVTTNHIAKHRRVFLSDSRRVLADMQRRHGLLFNYVDVRNKDAIRWLAWLGFTIGDAVPYGVHGLPFAQFSINSTSGQAPQRT